MRRLLSDSTILSRCKAPSLVSLYEAGKRTLPEKTLWYLVLDQAPMGSLKDLIIRGETLTPWQLVSYASRACRALREAHGAGVIHGNLHPGNLLFDAAMQIHWMALFSNPKVAGTPFCPQVCDTALRN